ncbi:MAG TPA: hypothetical protein VH020_16460 [Stellaceae bacterium]|jgi:hypothetical protein|nr:hypothetical protein [Stellaceae bacterium]
MSHIADGMLSGHGRSRRAVAQVLRWFETLDYTGFDHTLDRIEQLESEVAWLRKAIRDNHPASSDGPASSP